LLVRKVSHSYLSALIAIGTRAEPRDNQPYGGPGSVVVSEIDLSSPLNYGTPSSHGGLAGIGLGSQGSGARTPGVRGTPIRVRSDIQSEKKLRQVMSRN
jgi:hypothetical protein